jgi:hypothetical protein
MVLLGFDGKIFKLKEPNVKLWIKFFWVSFHERGATSRIAKQRPASQNDLCSMELVADTNH